MSGASSDEELAKEVLRRKLVTSEQVREALAEQAREVAAGRPKPRPLSNILIGRGYLSLQQFSELATPEAQPSSESRYSIREEIARGGMGAILKVSERRIRRDVAMKVMLDDSDEGARSRFLEEAQVTGQLEHPNIVPVHELGTDEKGRPFFTMKLVKGRSLGQVLKELRKNPASAEPNSLPKLLTTFVSICNALAFAHSKGVVHRDLKPANIMLGDYGEVLVMDWGLAKVGAAKRSTGRFTPPAGQPHTAAADDRLAEGIRTLRDETGGTRTLDGEIMGTPHYMPPEQATGDIAKIDERSDVYALGAILYEILTYLQPVEGKTVQEVLRNVVDGAILPPSRRAPERTIPAELSAVALKALAKDPADRYARVEDLRRDIELYLEGRAVSAKHDTAWETLVKLVRRNKGAGIAAGVAAIALLGVGGVSYAVNLQARRHAERSAKTAEVERGRAEGERQKAERALSDFKAEEARRIAEENARTGERRKSAPLFLASAQKAVLRKEFDAALLQIEVAASYDPRLAEARLLLGQLLMMKQRYPEAAKELEEYSALVPNDADALALLELCRKATADRGAEISAQAAPIFTRQRAYALAEELGSSSGSQLDLYRQRLRAAWPQWHPSNLFLGPDGLSLKLSDTGVTDLTAVLGIPLRVIDLKGTGIVDIAPLEGLPLIRVQLPRSVVDLRPLRRMKLKAISFDRDVVDFGPLEGMPLEWLGVVGNGRLEAMSWLKDAPLKGIRLESCSGVDYQVLKGKRLTRLEIVNIPWPSDPTFLEGMPLEHVDASGSGLKDLRILKEKALKSLCIRDCLPKGFAELQNMPLESLDLARTNISDLSPLRNLPLRRLHLQGCSGVSDLTPILHMRLDVFELPRCTDAMIASLAGMTFGELVIHETYLQPGSDLLGRLRVSNRITVTGDIHTVLTSRDQKNQLEGGLWRPCEPIVRWKIAGPFAHPPAPSLDAELVAAGMDLKEVRGQKAGWQTLKNLTPSGIVNLRKEFNMATPATAYAVTELQSDSEQRIEFIGGRDDALVLWLNGTKIHEDAGAHPFAYRAFRAPATLKPGRNVLLVRCTNTQGDWMLCLNWRPVSR